MTRPAPDSAPRWPGAAAPSQPAFAPAAAGVLATGAKPAPAHDAGAAGHAAAASTAEPPGAPPPPVAQALRQAYRAALAGGVHGLCFSPYVAGQAPGSAVSAAQIRQRLALVQPHTGWVRTFSCTEGHEQTPAIAKAMGLKTLVGAWLGIDREINAREIDGLITVARAGHADLVAVGNEVLLREDMSEDELIAQIEQVKQALPGVPVGYVDAYYLFEKHPRVTAACDVVMTNCYPFWEGCPREQAVDYMRSMFQRTRAAAPGKRVLISETGWPDQGGRFHGAVASEEGAMRYFIDTLQWVREEGIELFYFAAFDEAWKVDAEGGVGAFWGLWDADGRPKFGGAA